MANFISVIGKNMLPGKKRIRTGYPDVFVATVDAIPSDGSGTRAPLGSIAIYVTGASVQIYYKSGEADTAWSNIASASGVEEQPAIVTRLFPESPENEVIDRWFVNGSWYLDAVAIYAVDGVSTSAAGTYTLEVRKEANGVETVLDTFNLEGLANQTVTYVPLTGAHLFEQDEFLQIAIISDNADLTGGNGISVTPKFIKG